MGSTSAEVEETIKTFGKKETSNKEARRMKSPQRKGRQCKKLNVQSCNSVLEIKTDLCLPLINNIVIIYKNIQ